jgi:hypothetical protein
MTSKQTGKYYFVLILKIRKEWRVLTIQINSKNKIEFGKNNLL